MVLFCKLCRSRGGNTKFALDTTDLSLEAIKNHLNTNEHKQSESHYSHTDQYELNREMFDKEKSSIHFINEKCIFLFETKSFIKYLS